ncbi:MAG: hypothetical protein IKO36_06700 [Bacteroidaceae bacterium]|nr:hypothetical protein [Bacteroidaceae bacterium]
MIKSYLSFINEGFTVDDEIAAIYLRIFKEGGFNKQDGDDDEEFMDIDMWHSLSELERNEIIRQSNFTGFLDESGDKLIICSICKFDYLFGSALDCIDNRIFNNNKEDDDSSLIISYSKALPGTDGEQYKTFDVGDTEIEYNPFIRSGKNIKWKNRIVSQNIEWMQDNMWEDVVYIKNDNAAKSFAKYTGYNYYKNGKKII